MQTEVGGGFGVKGGGVLILLRNNLTNVVGTYGGAIFGGEIGVGFAPVVAHPTSFSSMWMPEEMTFAGFDGAWFSIESSGFAAGAIGYSVSTLYLRSLPNGEGTPDGVDISGLSFGGLEANVYSYVSGTMNLMDKPSEDYDLTFRMTHTQSYVSEGQEPSEHRVLFATGQHTLTETQHKKLKAYLAAVSLGL